MRVAAIMPIYNTPLEWQEEAVCALEQQQGISTEFDLTLVRVFREDAPGSHPRYFPKMPFADLTYAFSDKRPTPIEQCAVGMKYAFREGFDYMFCLSSNDVYESDYVSSCLAEKAMVAYGDVGLCDDGMIHNRTTGAPRLFDPVMLANRGTGLPNYIPDCALVNMDVYRKIRFVTLYHRQSFHVWWLEIWEQYGSDGFSHIGKVGFWMRAHDYRHSLPDRGEYMKDGARLARNYLNTKSWIKELRAKIEGREAS